MVQEIALPSGRVLFEWKSLDHVDVAETHAQYMGHPLDYFHINSIDLTPDGGLLVSARNTWAVYKISRRTGEIRWRLGGKRSDFKMGKGTVFAWQHDARHQGHNRITIFDDGALPQVEPQSRGLVSQLDQKRRHCTARPQVRPSAEPDRVALHGKHAGARQRQRDDRLGQRAVLHRVRSERRDRARRAAPGRRHELPRVPAAVARAAVAPAAARSTATRTGRARLRVVERRNRGRVRGGSRPGPRPARSVPAAAVARKGFETALRTTPGDKVARAVALDESGHVLGRSKTLRI